METLTYLTEKTGGKRSLKQYRKNKNQSESMSLCFSHRTHLANMQLPEAKAGVDNHS